MLEPFYEATGKSRWRATESTRGPWDPRMQHGGPPAALLARALADADPVVGQQLARITYEILRPVPITTVRIRAEVDRPGKKVSMVTAVLTDDDDTELMLARAWRLQTTPESLPAADETPAPAPLDSAGGATWFADDAPGFQRAVDVRFLVGDFVEAGPATAWFRLLVPLVADTVPRPTDVLLVTADCGNGISASIDFERYVFINTDLSVSIDRLPCGEWVCLDAATAITPGGVSHARGVISDTSGRLARASQTLFVSARGNGS